MESDCLMCGGKEFQSLGAEQLKARAPMVLRRDVRILADQRRMSGGCGRECVREGGRRGKWGIDCGELYR